MDKPKTLIVIGNGIASWRVNAELEKKFIESNIIRIGADDFAPKCSFRTTSINCLRGTQKNISPLGDLIVDSYREFESFYQECRPLGVEKTFELQLWRKQDADKEKWEKRFADWKEVEGVEGVEFTKPFQSHRSTAYLITPELFYLWQIKQFKRTEYVNDHVIEIKRDKNSFVVGTQQGKKYFGDKIFLCASYLTHNFLELVENSNAKDFIQRCKPVRGSFMMAKTDFFDKSFSLAFGQGHLIFRAGDQSVMVGSTSENDSALQIPMEEELEKKYQKIKGALKDPSVLPDRGEWEIVHGVRHKGRKREPFWGELSPNCYGMFGLYKNAFSFSFLGAKKLVEALP